MTAQIRLEWSRPREYGALVSIDDLRDLFATLPGSERDTALTILADIEAGLDVGVYIRTLAYILASTETGQEYLAGLENDDLGNCGGTGRAEISDIDAVDA